MYTLAHAGAFLSSASSSSVLVRPSAHPRTHALREMAGAAEVDAGPPMAEEARVVPDRAVTLSKEELVYGLQVVLKSKRFDDVSIKQARRSLASHFGLPENALDCRKGEIRDLAHARNRTAQRGAV